MIENSFFLGTLIRLTGILKKLYDGSMIKRVIEAVSGWFLGVLSGSAVLGFFITSDEEHMIKGSLIIEVMARLRSVYEAGIGKRLKGCFESSRILGLYDRLEGYFLALILMSATLVFLPTKISMAMAAMVIVFYIYDVIRSKVAYHNPSFTAILIFMFIVLMTESTVNAINISNAAMIALIYIVFILALLTAASGINSKKKLLLLVNVLLLVMLITCLHAFYQYVVGVEVDSAWIDEEMFDSNTVRIYSVFGNPNVFGIYLVMMVPLAVAMFFSVKSILAKIWYLGVGGAGIICIALTYSRGSMVSVALAIGIMLLLMDYRFISLVVAGVLSAPFVLPASIMNRLMSIGNMQESSWAYRVSIYRAASDLIKDFYIGGLGLGGFNEVYFAYAYAASKAFHAHNTFLMVLLELGPVGFLLFVMILVFWVKRCLSTYFKSSDKTMNMLILAAIGGVAGASIQGLVEHIWFNSDVMVLYWLMIVIGLVAARLTDDRIGSAVNPENGVGSVME